MRLRVVVPRALVWLVPIVPPAWAQVSGPPPTFGARTELVIVDVVVADGQGRPMEGLTREDFRVLEDGRVQDVATFEAVGHAVGAPSAPSAPGVTATRPPTEARTVAIVFDDLHLRPFDAERLKTAVRDLLSAESALRAQVALVAPGAGIARMGALPEAQPDLENVLRLLKGLAAPVRPDMSEQEAYEINALRNEPIEILVAERFLQKGLGGIDMASTRAQVRGRAAEMDREWSLQRQSTLEAMAQTLGWLAGVKGRRSLVLASRGFVYDSDLHGYRQAVGASRRANVPVHLLDARGLEGLLPFQDLDMQEPSLPRPGISTSAHQTQDRVAAAAGAEHVALDTGGLVLRNRNDLAAGLRQIAESSRVYYLLGFYPKDGRRDGKWRKLKVEVAKGPGRREVRVRRGYFAPLD